MDKDASNATFQALLQRNCQRLMLSLDYLKEEDQLCDVGILIDSVQINAHKVVLAAGSQFFR